MANGNHNPPHWMETRLHVSRVDQRKKWFCGAACAEMILEHFGLEIDQAEAYSQIHDRDRFQTERLYSDPQGLVEYINNQNDQTEMVDVVDITSEEDSEVIDDIFRVLMTNRTPAALLALGGDHWVVIDGVRYQDSLDGRRNYAGFYIQNPWKGSTPDLWVEIEEFGKRWIQPNKFGERWLGKLVLIANPDGRRRLVNNRFVDLQRLPGSAVLDDPESSTLSLVQELGFQQFGPIAGGGAVVLEPLQVLNEDDSTSFHLVPLDAVANREFGDFVYVAVDDDSQKVLEISRLSEQLDIPTDEEALQGAQQVFPDANLVVEPEVYWRTRLGAVSRTDVYRKINVDGVTFYMLRDGTLQRSLELRPSYGG